LIFIDSNIPMYVAGGEHVNRDPDRRLLDRVRTGKIDGSVASFGAEQEFAGKVSFPENSGGHFEEFVDEPILTPDARSTTALGPFELCASPHSPESFVAQPGIRETLAWRSLAA
jgi:hypothetical protein